MLCEKAVLFYLAMLFTPAVSAQTENALWHDASEIVLPDRCKECHRREFAVWENTDHALGTLVNRSGDAEGIKERMGVISMKHESLCIKCHFTGVIDERTGKPVGATGVSCESCHGAAKDWVNVHNLFGAGHTRETETPAHRKERLRESAAAGMILPDDLYGVIANCYRCHTIPQEQLVNVGEHTVGGTDFVVDRKIDELRHNFLHSGFNASDSNNAEIPALQRRWMRVVGACIDLEFSLRGVAEATEPEGRYLRSMQRRVNYAENALTSIADRASLPELRTILARVQRLSIDVGQRKALLSAADEIRKETHDILRLHGGESLDSLDIR